MSRYVVRPKPSWSTGALNGNAHLWFISCFSAVRPCLCRTSSSRFARSDSNAATSNGAAELSAAARLECEPPAGRRPPEPLDAAIAAFRRRSALRASEAAASAAALRRSRAEPVDSAFTARRSTTDASSAYLRFAFRRRSRSAARRCASAAGADASRWRASASAARASASALAAATRARACSCAAFTMRHTTGSSSGSNENATGA